ncbi:tRNA (cytidine/uridine-2'-O-)-methyltransferase TrmJ [Halomicronema hongdechloris C2206]|uniref:tRNA (cytidine/uridine-2'-O-)-methyltransferase TrmJ n=1 Tax=Halomicronema hongdechloris C2206 TaxID=1641165 RepID=A0A1Z3HP35_9CYAN|nr:RNA methyltransferase [Halomicronema hongdechloris]ASC72061.1 tRNA (cytidine/uridine-2'-O-)-methyltransferase TrmJ [Halomicronema hongdechloris C2206]
MALDHIRIVLVEPAGPLNVGSVARVMKNMGLSQLVLVNPHCDPNAAAAQQMAVHGQDVLTAARRVDSLPQALQGCRRTIATTARPRSLDSPLETPEIALPWLLAPEAAAVALIFGPEDRGLNNIELNYAQRLVRIPANPDYPSLNLAQAVAVCSYLLSRLDQSQATTAASAAEAMVPGQSSALREAAPAMAPHETTIAPDSARAAIDQIDGFYSDLEALLLKIGYLYPHTANSRMQKLRRLMYRTAPTSQELAMLRGIIRQVEWALAASDPNTLPSP